MKRGKLFHLDWISKHQRWWGQRLLLQASSITDFAAPVPPQYSHYSRVSKVTSFCRSIEEWRSNVTFCCSFLLSMFLSMEHFFKYPLQQKTCLQTYGSVCHSRICRHIVDGHRLPSLSSQSTTTACNAWIKYFWSYLATQVPCWSSFPFDSDGCAPARSLPLLTCSWAAAVAST